MREPQIQLLEDLGAEFRRVAGEHQRSPHRSRLRMLAATPRRALALAVGALVLLLGAGYAVPPTRAALEDLTSTFAGWAGGEDDEAPGRALRPREDAPYWAKEGDTRLIAERAGVRLTVTRSGEELGFSLGDGTGIANTAEGWREEFREHAIVVLGPAPLGRGRGWLDERGRFALLGLTARSVRRLELRYTEGPPLVERDVDGGFVLLADAWRPLRELVAYDAAGRELERVDVGYLDKLDACQREPGCPER